MLLRFYYNIVLTSLWCHNSVVFGQEAHRRQQPASICLQQCRIVLKDTYSNQRHLFDDLREFERLSKMLVNKDAPQPSSAASGWLDTTLPKLINIYTHPELTHRANFIDIRRPNIFGNPFRKEAYGREGCIELYNKYIRNNPYLIAKVPDIKQSILGCVCEPLNCHGRVLISLVNELC